MTPNVSVLMPVFNREQFLPTAIESVLAQTIPDWELIISDNLSTDESLAIARRYALQDHRIRVYRNHAHCTAVENFNLCYQRMHPNSTYIALLASDDWWEPTFLERTTAIGNDYPQATFIHTDMYRTNEHGYVLNLYSDLYPNLTPDEGLHQHVRQIFQGNYINIMAALIRRTYKARLCPRRDLFDAELKLTPDYEFWLQLLIRGAKGYYINEPLAYYRKHAGAMTMPARQIERMQEEVIIFQDKLVDICHHEHLDTLRQDGLQQRLAHLGFELLSNGRADEAFPLLAEAHLLCAWKRLDVTVARVISSLPVNCSTRSQMWQGTLATARLLGRVA